MAPPLLDVDEEDRDLGERNMKQCKRKIWDGHFTTAVKILSSSSVAPYNDATLEDLKSKHPLKPAPSLPHIPIGHHHLIAFPAMVLDRIKSFPRGTSFRRDGLRAQHLLDCLSGAAIVISDELLSFITQVQQGDPFGPTLFSLVLHSLICKIRDSFSLCLHAWYLDDCTFVGDTLVVGKPKEDPRSKIEGVFLPNIVWPLHGVKLLSGPASVDFDFSSELVMKRVTKALGLMEAVAKINDP
ncbi:hypothetical protein Tco_1085205 [Tanacetum coccineum]